MIMAFISLGKNDLGLNLVFTRKRAIDRLDLTSFSTEKGHIQDKEYGQMFLSFTNSPAYNLSVCQN